MYYVVKGPYIMYKLKKLSTAMMVAKNEQMDVCEDTPDDISMLYKYEDGKLVPKTDGRN